MKQLLLPLAAALFAGSSALAETVSATSPDGLLQVHVTDNDGKLTYSITYDGKPMLVDSRLGINTNIADYSQRLSLKSHKTTPVSKQYEMRGTKANTATYTANLLQLEYATPDSKVPLLIEFSVGNNDVGFRYEFPESAVPACIVVESEATSFRMPEHTTTFICPQSDPMIGWMRTKPSYEEEYVLDAPMSQKSAYGHGYTFPCLFRIGDDGWALISETGTDSNYVGCHLSDYDPESGYTIAFPMPGEANSIGTTTAGMAFPCRTPWRTITVGSTLAPIVETTVSYDLVDEQYSPSQDYQGGRYTWSWLIWQDNSINEADTKKFIDTAAAMGFEYCLVDNWWDKQIGRDKIAELSKYAQDKGVHLMLWYNSNGYENDAPQTPKGRMDRPHTRREEMAWLKSIGVKGIKVDFFGGDKQHTMQLYEDILRDANDYGLQVVFHGCTLPRGWEKMFPNYVASEAVLASENVFFDERHAKREAQDLTLHPFCRNATASMDWGGVIMNRYMAPDNMSRHRRHTTDTFEMASGIVMQTPVQCVAIQPNNLEELSDVQLDFLRKLPTEWEETKLIDGYPGKYVVLARRHGNDWYIAGLNAGDEALDLTLDLPMMSSTMAYYTDKPVKCSEFPDTQLSQIKKDKKGKVKVTIHPKGGIILK